MAKMHDTRGTPDQSDQAIASRLKQAAAEVWYTRGDLLDRGKDQDAGLAVELETAFDSLVGIGKRI